MRSYERNLLWIMRVALCCAGFVAGFFIMRQIAFSYPALVREDLVYVYCAGTGVFLGAICMLSASSVLWLCFTVCGGIKKTFGKIKLRSVLCVIIGVVAGVLLTVLFDFLLSLGVEVFGLRIVLDVAFALVAVASAVMGVLQLFRLSGGWTHRKTDNEFTSGYLLTASALKTSGIERFCKDWLFAKAVVLDCTVGELIGGKEADEAALERYRMLIGCGKICTASSGSGAETEEVLKYARKYKLRIVTGGSEMYSDVDVPVLSFDDLRRVDGE